MVNENWSECRLDEYLTLLTDYDANGSFADMAANVHTEWGHGYAWYVRATDLEQNLPLSEVRYADKSSYDFLRKSTLYGGELLMAKRGEIGKVYFFEMKTKYATLAPNLYLLKLNDKADSRFLYYYFLSKEGQRKIKAIKASTSLGAIYKDDVKRIMVPYIGIEEQKNIAASLSDVDRLIANLQKLIRKKMDIRQGTMQMLVTGKKRLDGFSGDWVKINLAKNSRLKARIGWQGLTTAEYLDEGYSYLITGTDFKDGRINWNGCHYVDYDRYVQDPNIQVTNGDLLLTKDGTIGKVAFVADLKRPATLNSGVFLVKPITNAYTARFMFYVLESSVFKNFLQQLSAGSTINHLYQKDLVKFDLFVPPTKEEQEAIAGILYDMDCDIHKLEEKLSKYQKVKQGMMEELLTGKVRLV